MSDGKKVKHNGFEKCVEEQREIQREIESKAVYGWLAC